jgi:hypothetical protein
VKADTKAWEADRLRSTLRSREQDIADLVKANEHLRRQQEADLQEQDDERVQLMIANKDLAYEVGELQR